MGNVKLPERKTKNLGIKTAVIKDRHCLTEIISKHTTDYIIVFQLKTKQFEYNSSFVVFNLFPIMLFVLHQRKIPCLLISAPDLALIIYISFVFDLLSKEN